MKRYVIVDIDGTLSDSRRREHHAQNKDWDAFHSAAKDDPPVEAVVEVVHALSNAAFKIIACTGRPEKYRRQTFDWMLKNEIAVDALLMRPDLDFQPDAKIKIELVEEYLRIRKDFSEDWKESILCVLEDRDGMVEKWRELGVDCWQVKAGAY